MIMQHNSIFQTRQKPVILLLVLILALLAQRLFSKVPFTEIGGRCWSHF